MERSRIIVLTLPGSPQPSLAVAACRAGAVGVIDCEYIEEERDALEAFDSLYHLTDRPFGIRLPGDDIQFIDSILDKKYQSLTHAILAFPVCKNLEEVVEKLQRQSIQVYQECFDLDDVRSAERAGIDGIVAKGNEAGGLVSHESSFILLQRFLSETTLPVYVQGGIGLHSAAACIASGAAGVVIDSQCALTTESPIPGELKKKIASFDGTETVCLETPNNLICRISSRLNMPIVKRLTEKIQKYQAANTDQKEDILFLRECISENVVAAANENKIYLLGQDIGFAGYLGRKYVTVGGIVQAITDSVNDSKRLAIAGEILQENSLLAKSHNTQYPIVQGPMARISDTPEFALKIAESGALPFLAAAMIRGQELEKMLSATKQLLQDKPFGVGLLGFMPDEAYRKQLKAMFKVKPQFALIAGGRPEQAEVLEEKGIATYLHVPSPGLLKIFLNNGARRFVFEGREAGGHVAPLCSFVLWESMSTVLLEYLEQNNQAEDLHVLFAGGIHDSLSSAVVAVLAAPLARLGVKVGLQLGSIYLFTNEIVGTGAIEDRYRKEVVASNKTVLLETGLGHASRCTPSPFTEEFLKQKKQLQIQGKPVQEIRDQLEKINLGRLRIAAKGIAKQKSDAVEGKNELVELNTQEQHRQGLYMVGQLGSLRDKSLTITEVHMDISTGGSKRLRKLAGKRKRKTRKNRRSLSADIAIIGMEGILPGAESIQKYWNNILNSVNAIREIPKERWDWRLYYDADRSAKDKVYSKWGGFVEDMVFDPTRYGMPPKSIESVDPMQLMALEIAFRTLADAGYQDRYFERDKASVIIGASGGAGDVGIQYGLRAELPRFQGGLPNSVAERLPEWTEDTFAGILLNVIAGRIANRLNFGGVNYTTDAACASSLTAVYQGVNELIAGRSDLVVAGGVDTVQGPFGYLCFSKTQALSPRGRCNTFDTSADGIVISEGIAMILLKRLADAERDGDRIYAVIKGIGASSDGRAKGLTAPLPAGQMSAMRRAYEQAGFGPDTVELFEAHGTGTVAGDTAELESTISMLKEAGARPHNSVVGSVKTMIGHTKATAGVAGLIKAALSLHHQVLPPHFGVKQPNQVLQQPDCPLYLIDQPMPWLVETDRPRRAASSAFGFGGTNFHAVLEEYSGEYRPQLRSAVAQQWPAELLLFGADGRSSLIDLLSRLHDQLKITNDIELRDIAYSLAKDWRYCEESIAIVAEDFDDLLKKVSGVLDFLQDKIQDLPVGIYHGNSSQPAGEVAVLFSGQGSQYPGMAQEVALHFPVFAQTLAEADDILNERFFSRFGDGVRLSHFILPRGAYDSDKKRDAAKALTSTDVAQPALGAVGAGYWRLINSFGLYPEMLGGHSYGEFAALFASGHYDFATLMALSEARGRYIVDNVRDAGAELGTMAAVQADRAEVEKTISGVADVIIANHNAPRQSIISGSKESVSDAVEKLSEKGIKAGLIPVAAAFHSSFVQAAQANLADLIENTTWHKGTIQVYSNTVGDKHSGDIEEIKQTMAKHLVKPVEFVSQIEAMYRDGARIFLELGPKTVLTGLVGRILNERPHKAVSVDGIKGGVTGILNTFGQLTCAGIRLDTVKLFEGRGCIHGDIGDLSSLRRRTPVPKHAWILNSSGVRRAGEPVKQIGVRIEDKNNSKNNSPRESMQADGGDALNSQNESTLFNLQEDPKNHGRNPKRMNRRQTPHASDPGIMAEYFDTMRQFLDTQERIMSMYLGGVPAGRRQGMRPARTVQKHPYTKNPEQDIMEKAPRVHQEIQPAKTTLESETPIAENSQALKPDPQSNPETGSAHGQAPQEKTAGETPDDVIDRSKMTGILLDIVEDKTGYPKDMIGMDQNLEADLGIDSIKRVEIVGAMMKTLPSGYGEKMGDDLSDLNTQSTLNGMLDLLAGLKPEEVAARPFDQAGMGTMTLQDDHPFRHIIEPEQEAINGSAPKILNRGHFVITSDKLGVAQTLSEMLIARECSVSIVDSGTLEDEASLKQWCSKLKKEHSSLAGIVHLAQIGAGQLQADGTTQDWLRQLQANEKSLFILLHDLNSICNEHAHILSASSLGGEFCRRPGKCSGLSLQGGAVGMLKSLSEELPGLRIRVVDLDAEQETEALAATLINEMELIGGRLEVGYPEGNRTIFKTVSANVEERDESHEAISDLVVLATGGLKGVTAEILREVAVAGNTIIVTGRSTMPEDVEHETLKKLQTEAELREFFIDEVRKGNMQITPAEIKQKIRSVLAAREMRGNLEDFRQRGASVEYYAVDVTDDDGMRELVNKVQGKYGPISGVVHGAGIIEDKLLSDKTSESWSRVVETKIIGLLLLQKYLDPDALRFFTVFSSVAGRYGNSGQSDYATANELMNRICCQLRNIWPNKVNIKALCWGPWGPTLFGAGMVTAETEAKFAEKGVFLVSAEAGRNLFINELTHNRDHGVEIICGQGPWEEREVAMASADGKIVPMPIESNAPLLNTATMTTLDDGKQIITLNLNSDHSYLQDHRIDNIQVLPAAAALEIMAEAAGFLWPGWKVCEVRDCRLLKGIEVKEDNQTLNIVIETTEQASRESIEVNASIESTMDSGNTRYHYRAVLRLAPQVATGFTRKPHLYAEKNLEVHKAYAEWLFHGPRFQVIEEIAGLSDMGAQGLIRTTSPGLWMKNSENGYGQWIFDPALVDAAPQMAILWSRAFRDETALPARFDRIVRFAETLPEKLVMDFERVESEESHLVRANIYFSDDQDNVMLMIEGMECISSAELNRICGTAKSVENITA